MHRLSKKVGVFMTTNVAKRSTATQENGAPDTTPQMTAWPVTTKTDEQVLDYLIRARVKLLISAPFFGTIATRLKFIDASKWCPTAATDGKNFYYNKDFVAALQDKDEEQVVFLVGHEVLHCVYDHMDKQVSVLRLILCKFVLNTSIVT